MKIEEIESIAIDIDGTLTGEDRRLDCAAVEAIRKLSIPVILVTGNVICFASAASKLVGTSGEVIAENGGVVKLDFDGEEVILGDKRICLAAYDHLKEFLDLETIDMRYRKSEVALKRGFDVGSARDLLKDFNVDIVDSGFAVHIKRKGINKLTGLSYVFERRGWDLEKTVAIGDSRNDAEVIRGVGFGIAVGNAEEDLKEIADYATLKDHGEGVVEALEYLGLV
ncbi:MAG: Phosphoglycolate phosphatase [Candidatus Methanolliviera sp. GoM_oil]|nr:MAG: Phosphoglycolate phosphatase [Candidatus Methanolliviera sp. GoM_oil]